MREYYDYHIHTNNSHDSDAAAADCARSAIEKGLAEICFTDHHELDYPCAVDFKMEIQLADYLKRIDDVIEAFPQLKIKRGIETGLLTGSLQKIADDFAGHDFDFIIASQHVAQGKDPWFGDYYDEWELREGQEIYLKEILACIESFENFDVIGHIGYVDKYLSKYPQFEDPKPFIHEDFPDIIDAILKNVISRGKGIEVNTSNYPVHGYPTPHPSIIKRYAQLGGEILTTGSDSHSPQALATEFAAAYELLLQCGVKYVCTYTKRVPEFHKI